MQAAPAESAERSRRFRLPGPRAVGVTFQSLENPAFARYFWGAAAFFFAMNMQLMLRGWLAYVLTKDTFALGLVSAAVALPTLVFSPLGGVAADRLDRRLVIVTTQIIQLVLALLTAVLVLTDTIQFWQLLLLTVLVATTGSFNLPARQALVPELVGKDALVNATALASGALNVSRVAAPALAGLLVAPLGIGGTFLVTVGFYALAVMLFARLPRTERSDTEEKKSVVDELMAGVRFVCNDPVVPILLLLSIALMLMQMPQMILLPAFAEVFHTGAGGVGVMQAAGGIGGLAGAALAANIGRPRWPARLMTCGLLGYGGFVALFALSSHLAPALLWLALGDAVAMIALTVNTATMQGICPDTVRGRVMALNLMTFGLTPLAVLPASAAARSIGVQATLAWSSLLLAAFAVVLYARSRSFRALDRTGAVLDTSGPLPDTGDD